MIGPPLVSPHFPLDGTSQQIGRFESFLIVVIALGYPFIRKILVGLDVLRIAAFGNDFVLIVADLDQAPFAAQRATHGLGTENNHEADEDPKH
jgi:hypothetical protein